MPKFYLWLGPAYRWHRLLTPKARPALPGPQDPSNPHDTIAAWDSYADAEATRVAEGYTDPCDYVTTNPTGTKSAPPPKYIPDTHPHPAPSQDLPPVGTVFSDSNPLTRELLSKIPDGTIFRWDKFVPAPTHPTGKDGRWVKRVWNSDPHLLSQGTAYYKDGTRLAIFNNKNNYADRNVITLVSYPDGTVPSGSTNPPTNTTNVVNGQPGVSHMQIAVATVYSRTTDANGRVQETVLKGPELVPMPTVNSSSQLVDQIAKKLQAEVLWADPDLDASTVRVSISLFSNNFDA